MKTNSIITIIIVVVLLIGIGVGGYFLYEYYENKKHSTTGSSTPTSGPQPTGKGPTTPSPTTPSPTTPSPTPSNRVIQNGDMIVLEDMKNNMFLSHTNNNAGTNCGTYEPVSSCPQNSFQTMNLFKQQCSNDVFLIDISNNQLQEDTSFPLKNPLSNIPNQPLCVGAINSTKHSSIMFEKVNDASDKLIKDKSQVVIKVGNNQYLSFLKLAFVWVIESVDKKEDATVFMVHHVQSNN